MVTKTPQFHHPPVRGGNAPWPLTLAATESVAQLCVSALQALAEPGLPALVLARLVQSFRLSTCDFLPDKRQKMKCSKDKLSRNKTKFILQPVKHEEQYSDLSFFMSIVTTGFELGAKPTDIHFPFLCTALSAACFLPTVFVSSLLFLELFWRRVLCSLIAAPRFPPLTGRYVVCTLS